MQVLIPPGLVLHLVHAFPVVKVVFHVPVAVVVLLRCGEASLVLVAQSSPVGSLGFPASFGVGEDVVAPGNAGGAGSVETVLHLVLLISPLTDGAVVSVVADDDSFGGLVLVDVVVAVDVATEPRTVGGLLAPRAFLDSRFEFCFPIAFFDPFDGTGVDEGFAGFDDGATVGILLGLHHVDGLAEVEVVVPVVEVFVLLLVAVLLDPVGCVNVSS